MEYTEIIEMINQFRDARGWKKYHNLKDLAISVSLEASEVLEIFQWKDSKEELSEDEKAKLKEEIADTLIYLLYMVDKLKMNPYEEIQKKVEINKNRHWKEDS
ncbi:nucleotide pyrophosphohydrolase [Ligilactobacillus agilis]|uniref:nucleotide pyrophosphohydrolase n=1 Tax=Ligilactobacillus agilis TaxID=1601 RepID=UPI000B8D1D1B|nr:nucleotide pyrophosphohydrolase [Ligilactobacillus agilis]ASR41137.1 nucleotide pyrophosphohydrolase [Ligilactobacillus agilis]NJE32058.1 nucleotide pyrophosphohydrolase [Ligilactobacillus agilis]GET08311.1 hypothetical protein SY111_09350 [Ligilactobacillus agilis]GET11177.1 hypothetical protein SN10121_16670 [Ligilactobacillus agilis]GET19571.1 hypothetical protein PTL465_18890 [Ligilactobacillus agilis]